MKTARSVGAGSVIAAVLSALLLARSAPAEPPPNPPNPEAAVPPAPETSDAAPLSSSLTGAAKEAYEAARQLYRAGNFAGALLQFERAYDLASDVRLLWNVAVCEKNLYHYARARKTLERYQIEGGARLSEQARADGIALSKALSRFVSTLKISVSEPGASIFIDDELVGTSPLSEPLLVDMGARRIRVSKKRFYDFVEQRVLIGETDTAIDVKLTPELHVIAGKDDVIRLDGKVVGQGQWEGDVASGGHTLRVTSPGKKPYAIRYRVQEYPRGRQPHPGQVRG